MFSPTQWRLKCENSFSDIQAMRTLNRIQSNSFQTKLALNFEIPRWELFDDKFWLIKNVIKSFLRKHAHWRTYLFFNFWTKQFALWDEDAIRVYEHWWNPEFELAFKHVIKLTCVSVIIGPRSQYTSGRFLCR